MRLISIIALAAVGLLAGEARAQEYRARCDALQASIKDLPGVPQADKDRMTAAVTEYCGRRAACLASVRSAMQSKAAKLDGAWPDCVNRPPLDAIDKAVAALSPEVAFKPPALPLYSIGPQEAAFFQALNAALKSVGTSRDEVFTAWNDVTTYTKTVRDTEWPAVIRNSEQFCREVVEASKLSLWASATFKYRELADRINGRASAFAKAVALALASNQTNIDWQDILVMEQAAKDLNSAVIAARAESRTRAVVERAIYGSSGVMRLYIVLREYVRVFLGSYKGREAKLNEATGALDKFAAAAAAPGQADDAKLLAGQMRPELVTLGAEYIKAVDELDRLNTEHIVRMRDLIACTEPWNQLASRVSGEASSGDLAPTRRTLVDALNYNFGPYQSEVERRAGSAVRAADSALDAEMRARAEDLRAVQDGQQRSRQ